MQSLFSALDHIVVVAATLEEGVDFCDSILGVRPRKGGVHARMGTHNHVLNLDAGAYLEVIAIDPAVPSIDGVRWFEMDHPAQRARVAQGPYLATFVAATNVIAAAVAALSILGAVRTMQRGTLQWQMAIRDDGALIEHGTVPLLVQWPEGSHPTRTMPELGCRLIQLEVFHPQPERLATIWRKVGLDSDRRLTIQSSGSGEAPYLIARIDTPNGRKAISSNGIRPE